jgi:hypothetical protein
MGVGTHPDEVNLANLIVGSHSHQEILAQL